MSEEQDDMEDEMRAQAEERLHVAVSNVTKGDIQEVKALTNPPVGVKEVFEAYLVLKNGVVPASWNDCKKEMADPNNFIANL